MSYTPIVTDGSGASTVSTGSQTFTGAKTFTDGVQGAGTVPIGGMVVVMPNVSGNAWQPPVAGAIKDGFMRADGTTITATHVSQGCVFAAGTVLPNMVQKYPRGSTTSGSTGGANIQASNVTFGSQTVSTGGGSATFDKNVMNSNQNSHGHSQGSLRAAIGASGDDVNSLSYVASWVHGSATTVSAYTLFAGSSTSASRTFNHHTPVYGDTDGASVSWNSTTVTTTFNNPSFNQNSLTPTNNAVNNEPAYVEVIWVIRVK